MSKLDSAVWRAYQVGAVVVGISTFAPIPKVADAVIAGVVLAADAALAIAQRFGYFTDVEPIPEPGQAPAAEQKVVAEVSVAAAAAAPVVAKVETAVEAPVAPAAAPPASAPSEPPPAPPAA